MKHSMDYVDPNYNPVHSGDRQKTNGVQHQNDVIVREVGEHLRRTSQGLATNYSIQDTVALSCIARFRRSPLPSWYRLAVGQVVTKEYEKLNIQYSPSDFNAVFDRVHTYVKNNIDKR